MTSRASRPWALETRACAIPNAMGCERFNLLALQTFVRRDLKAAMENYCSRVEVVDSAAAVPSSPS